jgi:hypothetical protein
MGHGHGGVADLFHAGLRIGSAQIAGQLALGNLTFSVVQPLGNYDFS